MKRLSGTDALFLSMETPSWHQHIGALTIIEPADPPLTFDRVVSAIDARIAGAPKFRWKLKTMPLGLLRAAWVDDEDFDIRRHLRRVAVPEPGGARETAEVASMILSSQLDRNRPLWELWFLEGLANGRTALLMKYHHCLLDGVSAASLATLLMDLEPDATGPAAPPLTPEEQSAGPEPATAELVAQLFTEAIRRPLRRGRFLYGGARKLAAGAAVLARDEPHRAVLRPPAAPFNKPIGPRRGLSFASVSIDDLKQLKVHHDVKVNDVILALVAGALRSYLLDSGDLPDAAMAAGVPVSTRAEGDTALDNQVSNMFVSLATDIADPVERLQGIHTSSQSAKALQRAMGARQIQSLGEVATPLMLSTAIRAMYRTGLVSRVGTVANTVVSNIPGPPIPLYVCGARVAGMYPCSIILEGMGLNTTVISYIDRVDFGFVVDPDLVPDPWAVAERIGPALAELMEASGLGAPTSIADAFGDRSAIVRSASG